MPEQLECRVVVTHRPDGRISLGMYDPANDRYEPLGEHGPAREEIEQVVGDLARSIQTAGHRLTWCERNVSKERLVRK